MRRAPRSPRPHRGQLVHRRGERGVRRERGDLDGVGDGVDVAQLRRDATRRPPARRARRVAAPVSGREVGTSAISSAARGIAQAEQPPAAVGGRPEHRVGMVEQGSALGEQRPRRSAGCPSRPAGSPGRAAAPRRRRARRRCGRRARHPAAAIDAEPGECLATSAARAPSATAPASATTTCARGRSPGRGEGVQQRSGREVGRLLRRGGRAQPGLHPARHRRLRQHEDGGSGSVIAAAPPSPSPPGRCRAPSPTPSTGHRPAAGRRRRTPASRQPAAPARSSSSRG